MMKKIVCGNCSYQCVCVCIRGWAADWQCGPQPSPSLVLTTDSLPTPVQLQVYHVKMIAFSGVLRQDSMENGRRGSAPSSYSFTASNESLRTKELSRIVPHRLEKKFYRTMSWCKQHLGPKKSVLRNRRHSESTEEEKLEQTKPVRNTTELDILILLGWDKILGELEVVTKKR